MGVVGVVEAAELAGIVEVVVVLVAFVGIVGVVDIAEKKELAAFAERLYLGVDCLKLEQIAGLEEIEGAELVLELSEEAV